MSERSEILRWVQEEIISEIADMGGDATRRKWWNEAANLLGRLLEVAIEHPEITTSEKLRYYVQSFRDRG